MRVCLLGVSHWHAAMHLDAVRSSGGKVTDVWDSVAGAGASFADAHGVAVCDRVEQALERKPDLAVVMGSPGNVPDLALKIVSAGIPIILEKPAAPTTSALMHIVEAARSSGTFVGVPLPNRFGPIFRTMAELEAEERLGKLAHGHFRIVNGPPQRYRDDGVGWMLDPAVSGGGALRNLGIHGIDAALSLAQGTLRVVSASIGNRIFDERVEDHAHVTLRDEFGTLFTVEAGYTYASMAAGGDFEWRIATGNAYLIDRGETAQCATLDDGSTRMLAPEHPSTRYRLFMADTFDRLRSGKDPAVSIEDYLAAMQVIDAAYEKAKA
ncbi:Gfo/Idh/MocA family protein [Microvirga arabica]|uniref:Gfo/Idh/MocA family protein n=1 Tax=Microvirga arabica TaxID=1128671 RepID=UPI00193AB722|nr:Gfo/Idh/MocA family oxidoreductase [Microvirga arabica]MBM1173655.1 Gfo/Idh/MocA family oxidoreductase [Microvirga arabica]